MGFASCLTNMELSGPLMFLAMWLMLMLTPGAQANLNMTVHLSSGNVMPPLSVTDSVAGSIHLSFPDNIDPLANVASFPVYFDNLQLDSTVAQPITAIQLFAGGVNTTSTTALISFGLNTTSGVVQISPALFRSILADPANFFIAVYNEVYQDSGILRGQLPLLIMEVPVSSKNELPAISDIVNGSLILSFTDDAVCISDVQLFTAEPYVISGAHIHQGGSTQVGPVVVFFPITNDLSRPSCTSVDPKLVQAITTNTTQYYVNIHDLQTINYGFARNQLNTAVSTVIMGSGAQVPTANGKDDGTANARVLINVLDTNTVCFWKLAYTSEVTSPTALTITSSTASQNSAPLVSFFGSGSTFPAGGCLIVTDQSVIDQVMNPGSNHYVTLITASNSAGAAKGQLLPQGQISGNLLSLNQPTASAVSGKKSSSKKTDIIVAVVVCGAALLLVAACIAFLVFKRKNSRSKQPIDHTALAKKWFNWTPHEDSLPSAGSLTRTPSRTLSPPEKGSKWSPPEIFKSTPPVVIDMSEFARRNGEQPRNYRDLELDTRASSEERFSLRVGEESYERGQAGSISLGGKVVSAVSSLGVLPFGPEPVNSRSFTLREVLIATDYFNEKYELGGGGFGKVYKGQLEDGSIIAVKRMKKESKQGMREFINEVRLLGRLKHPNLVRLIGFCATDEEQLLCYEYMPNGNLAEHLRGANKPLSWRMRLEVAIGAAKGLDHLHVIATPPVIHRDVKSSNILLDEDWNSKVSDFGLSKTALTNASQPASSTFVRGTPGYFDPEYYEGQRLTEKSDVYAFGVVLLEMLTGKKPIDQTLPSAEGSLAKWARPHLREAERSLAIVDPRIQGSMTRASVLKVAALAYQCISLQGEMRPSMSTVVLRLHEANAS